jgi:MSHA biogenesis protein MshP
MSLVVAIFLITVIASLAAFAVTIGTATRESENLQLQSDRAMAAARAGVEWGAYRALVQASCPGTGTPIVGTPIGFNLNQAALRGFRVTVTCERLSAGASEVFEIVSFAQWSRFGAANYAYRRVVRRVW